MLSGDWEGAVRVGDALGGHAGIQGLLKAEVHIAGRMETRLFVYIPIPVVFWAPRMATPSG